MPKIEWKPAQEKAINADGNNILVSAAAGSGKTAVLVERVIRKVCDVDHPADLDRMVIITFTRAAASQMRDKIYEALREHLKEGDYSDEMKGHLKRQLMRVHNARISTIDSLCMEIVKENFQRVDIDPSFRIADEAECGLIKKDVVTALIEDCYAEPTDEFLKFVGFYTDKNDNALADIILRLYDFSQSHPEPDKWIERCMEPYESATKNRFVDEDAMEGMSEKEQSQHLAWVRFMCAYITNTLEELLLKAETVRSLAEADRGPSKYIPTILGLEEHLANALDEDCFFDNKVAEIQAAIDEWPARMPSYTKKDVYDEDMQKAAKAVLDEIKKELKDLRSEFLEADLETAFKDMAACVDAASAITGLTKEFSERFRKAKQDRKIADFGDVTHYALQILYENGPDGGCFSDVADRMAADIDEIIVDEYQDTNELQECLIAALSAERFGRPDVFMVGDVKQSIYGFRMACPELFNEKVASFKDIDSPDTEGAPGIKIVLDANFRSRHEVLDFANHVFAQAMIPEVGGIDYLDNNALAYASKDFKDGEYSYLPEITFLKGKGRTGKESEAYEIARAIEDVVANGLVMGKDKELRKVTYSDIAILVRTTDNNEIEYMLTERGIPLVKASNKGLFDTMEVRLMMNLLRIIDNPFQDIPFAAVLTSAIVGVTGRELAEIKIGYDEHPFSLYKAAEKWVEAGRDTTGAVGCFMGKLERYRGMAMYLPVSELLDVVSEDSGLLSVIGAMPLGDGRRANIDFLRARAEVFEDGSYTGLFNFIRYIDQIIKSDIDFGTAPIEGGAGAVRMMTIHKSKGLEFPVVILAKAGRRYSGKDASGNVVMHKDFGMGIKFNNAETRIKTTTLIRETIEKRIKQDEFAEEMRLLYVALTRAKEKLIVTGTIENLEDNVTDWADRPSASMQMSLSRVMKSNSHLKLLGYSLYNDPRDTICHLRLETEPAAELERVEEVLTADDIRCSIQTLALNGAAEDDTDEQWKDAFAYVYPHSAASESLIKITASQLEKHGSEDTNEPDKDREDEDKRNWKPKKKGSLTGAERGNAYHRFFELLDHASLQAGTDPAAMLDEMKAKGLISEEYASAIEPDKIELFRDSELGKRMAAAFAAGKLTREQQFVKGNEIALPDGGRELLLVQGIIDAFFEEDGCFVLVDYKTDKGKSEAEFADVYRAQLAEYKDAIERSLGVRVSEQIIYSVELGKPIVL